MRELKHKPIAFFRMDDTAPFQDWSGYGRNGVLTGALVKGLPLTSEASFSVAVDKTNYVTYTVPALSERNIDAYTIGATIYPRGDVVSQPLVSRNAGLLEGLFIVNDTIYFTTLHNTTSQRAECSYKFDITAKMDVFGVHTESVNRLFVNGEMVSEVSLTDEQRAGGYLSGTTGSTFVSGSVTTNNGGLLINNISFFNSPISGDDVADIYKYNNMRSLGSPVKGFFGEDVVFSRGIRPHYLTKTWDDQEEWNMGVFDGSTVDGDILNAQIEDGLTINGFWTDSAELKEDGTAVPIDSINLDWSGENVIVQVSVDETTWETVKRGKNITSVPTGFTPTDQQLYIRAVFDDGLPDAYLNNLRVDGYLEGTLTPVSGRDITFNKVVNRYEQHPALMRDDWGATINTGGSVIIDPDTDAAPLLWKTLEIWVKPITPITVSTGSTPSLTYTNGVSGYTSLVNQWVVYHYIYTTAMNPSITISGESILGKVAFYPTALTSDEIGRILANYTGIYTSTQASVGALEIAEGPNSTLIVDADWLESAAT